MRPAAAHCALLPALACHAAGAAAPRLRASLSQRSTAARFACAQLMQLGAKCLDFADAAGQSDMSLMLRRLLTDVPTCVRWGGLLQGSCA